MFQRYAERGVAVFLALGALAAWPLGAQTPGVFRAEARIVVVDVTVHGSGGEMVTDLDRSAFTVYENGKPQPISLFLRDDIPVSLGMVIDNSGSMRAWRSAVEAAALAFARASNPLDEVFVVNFADRPHVDVPLTGDVHILEAGISRIDSIGGTAVRDAVDTAEMYLSAHATRDRRVLLVITDGDDNASTVSIDRIRVQAEHSGIAVYAIGLPHGDPAKTTHGERELEDLAERTGGFAAHLTNITDVEPTAIRIAHYIRQQYTLGYTPVNQALDGSYRKIHVVVKGPHRLSTRTRAGYYATAAAR